MIEIPRCLRYPGPQKKAEVFPGHHRFAPENIGRTGQQHTHPVDLKIVEALDAVVDYPIFAPTHQPKRRCPVKEIMFPCAFPNEMPRVFRINSNRTATMSRGGIELAFIRSLEL